tara:strand:- start:15 stop:143 length:129 start_codon:yes stop_codon:yes gene_type:complete
MHGGAHLMSLVINMIAVAASATKASISIARFKFISCPHTSTA